jgi:NAD(P)-dependent dehydrogenase (short-subunit alcohol dehydrogenase family)
MALDVVVVIGVGGMGEAIARRQGSGRHLVIGDFNTATLDAVEARLLADGFGVTALQVDVGDLASVQDLADAAAALGPVAQVIHTAGLSPIQAPVEAILRVDIVGVANTLDVFGDVVAPGGAGVVIASMAGTMSQGRFPAEMENALALTPTDQLLGLPFLAPGAIGDPGAAYGIAKRANQLRVQTAAVAWGRRGARVNCLSPGIVATPMGHGELESPAGAIMRMMVGGSATGRIGTPEDVAAAAAFLLGPGASFITGADLLVDGGVVAAIRSGAIQLPTR